MQPSAHNIRAALIPRSVAVIGATDRSGALGREVFRNIVSGGFKGEVFAVNPKHDRIGAYRCYSSLIDLPSVPDLVVVVTPAAALPLVVQQSVQRGVAGVLVLSDGFAETGPAGTALQEQTLARARQSGVRLIGPNCLGLMRPSIGLNATFARTAAR